MSFYDDLKGNDVKEYYKNTAERIFAALEIPDSEIGWISEAKSLGEGPPDVDGIITHQSGWRSQYQVTLPDGNKIHVPMSMTKYSGGGSVARTIVFCGAILKPDGDFDHFIEEIKVALKKRAKAR